MSAALDRRVTSVMQHRAAFLEDAITAQILARVPVTHIIESGMRDRCMASSVMCGSTELARYTIRFVGGG